MAIWEEHAANHGQPQSLASGGGTRLLAKSPAAACCWVPPSLEDGHYNAVEEFQHPQEAAQVVQCAESRAATRWGGKMDLYPPEDPMASQRTHTEEVLVQKVTARKTQNAPWWRYLC